MRTIIFKFFLCCWALVEKSECFLDRISNKSNLKNLKANDTSVGGVGMNSQKKNLNDNDADFDQMHSEGSLDRNIYLRRPNGEKIIEKNEEKEEYQTQEMMMNRSLLSYSQEPVVFHVMGDVPYTTGQLSNLPHQLSKVSSDSEFVVHVGDMKRKANQCYQTNYTDVATQLRTSPKPMFIIPGDNDWADCLNSEEALSYWRESFLKFDKNWNKGFDVNYQKGRNENFSMYIRGVLFIGVHLIGGRPKDEIEWNNRIQDCLEWTLQNLKEYGAKTNSVVIFGHTVPRNRHKKYFKSLSLVASSTYKDLNFLYLHGDGHRWQMESNFKNKVNLLRVMVDKGGRANPLKVTVDFNGSFGGPTNRMFHDDRCDGCLDVEKTVPFSFQRNELSREY